jgi:uncharacterized protein YecE (DUF72 family)
LRKLLGVPLPAVAAHAIIYLLRVLSDPAFFVVASFFPVAIIVDMITVGTCSWAEKTLVKSGDFYPKEANTAEARLRYYAEFFNTVEIDSAFYALPSERNAALWAERTPDNFIFHVKVYAALTGHGLDPKTLPGDLQELIPQQDREREHIYIRDKELLQAVARRFKEALAPLKKAGKLGVMVFQFPPWFHYKPSNLDYVLTCKRLMRGLPVAVEFRHGSWFTPQRRGSVVEFLRKNKLINVVADEPQYGTLDTVPFVPEVTADIAYFRFHGRNKANWLKRGVEVSQKYNYFYSDDELRKFSPAILNVSRQAKTTYAMFNNCHGSFAVRNALRLREMLRERKREDVAIPERELAGRV